MAPSAPRPIEGLEVHVVEDGYVIHDDEAGRVHHLNLTSALVFDLCDGERPAESIAREVAEAFGLDAPPQAEVDDCIAQLTAEGVLVAEAEGGPADLDDRWAAATPGWHARHLRRLAAPATLVDVGVAAGTPSLHEAFPDARLLLVEPLIEWEPDLRRITASRPGSGYVLAAAGSAPGTRSLNVEPRHTERSSFFERQPFEVTGDQTSARDVPVLTLDSLLDDHGIEVPVGLKIDTEGFEYDVLLGATALLDRTAWVIAEVSLDRRFGGRTSVTALLTLLEDRGFELADVLDVGRSETTGDATFVDLVFTRTARDGSG